MLEKDMYVPLKNFFEEQGFTVQAEVNHVDLTAVKDDEVILVEMKTSINMKLLYQAAQRQRITDFVYVAIPKPSFKIMRSSNFKEKVYLLRRLHIGLILVGKTVNIHHEPKPFNMHISKGQAKRKKSSLMNEFGNRKTSSNIGGVSKTKIMTVYKENALLIASELYEPKSTKELRELHGIDKTSSILQKNYYGWFERVDRGVYQLTSKGIKDLEKYNDVIKKMKS